MATITTPVEGFTGVVVGVHFKDGAGETDNASAIQYFERHGYTVTAGEDPAPLTQPAKSASKAEWEAYATQEGKDIDGLTADQIKALFIAPETPQTPAKPEDGNPGDGTDPNKTEE